MTDSSPRKAVAIGGGTGLPPVLRSLVALGFDTTAIVTMADDGGSSGVLRRELGMLPPGDVRNCLVALADDSEGPLAQVFQYRFREGEGLAGHALGNLILAALTDITGDFAQAVELAARHLNARGRVLPSTLGNVTLHGIDREGTRVRGQASLACSDAPVAKAFIEPVDTAAYPPAVDAVRDADVVVMGPGSLYTSLIPNFLVRGIAEAVRESSALRVYVCNVANMRGETDGLDVADHVQALADHGLAGAIDVVVVHDGGPEGTAGAGVEAVAVSADALRRIEALGAGVVMASLADAADPCRHDEESLRRVLGEVLG